MKFISTFFIIFFFALTYAQENCTNGIDDDGDGFIDLNDSNCQCVESENLVPNGDFEQFDSLPSAPEQIHYATHWINPTMPYDIHFARASYNHWDAFTEIAAYPYPSGKGIVTTRSKITNYGTRPDQTYLDFYKEFFGVNLEQPLIPGETYVFSLFTYRLNNIAWNTWPQLNFGLYGSDGVLRPFDIEYARYPDYEEGWSELTRIPFYPQRNWQKISIEFTVDHTINALIFGLASGVPYSYYIADGTKVLGFDNLSIQKKSTEFDLFASGAVCAENLTLSARSFRGFTPQSYQWYHDGVAIAGATNPTLNLTEDMPEGYYAVRAMSATGCRNSQSYGFIKPVTDFRYKIEINDNGGSIRLVDIWNQSDFTYAINDGAYQALPHFTDVPRGQGFIYVKNELDCIIAKIPYAIFEIYNVITPNNDGMNDEWLIKGLEYYPNSIVRIYNQLGSLKYTYTIPENLTRYAWDGKSNGVPLASGEYWYIIEINDGRKIKGSLTIKRN